MVRLREVVAFVGKGRPATQAGNLKSADAVALAQRLAPGELLPGDVRSMPAAAGLLVAVAEAGGTRGRSTFAGRSGNFPWPLRPARLG